MPAVVKATDANLIKALCEMNARFGAPESAVQLLAALMPVTPDPGKILPPLVDQYHKQAAELINSLGPNPPANPTVAANSASITASYRLPRGFLPRRRARRAGPRATHAAHRHYPRRVGP